MNNYESYKETDIPWLGEIPSHWEIKRANIVFEERVEKVSDKDYCKGEYEMINGIL